MSGFVLMQKVFFQPSQIANFLYIFCTLYPKKFSYRTIKRVCVPPLVEIFIRLKNVENKWKNILFIFGK